ncbi:hypothetical protein AA313_de0205160 [Arthrobotrys entomopaga]|nr:hypothetical protein AA313_de0205160 [Arthrobotrys entomopaga]
MAEEVYCTMLLTDGYLPVDRITNTSQQNLLMMDRLDLSSAFTKIHLWSLTQFSKIVYIDADVVAIRAPEELFDIQERFAACPDIGWPDCFNSGVMVLKPDLGTFHGLKNLAQRGISFDGADQGLLNQYFRDWHRLSFVYNVTPSGHYQYVPAYNHYRSNITMAHFIGPGKPWTLGRVAGEANPSTPYGEMLGRWWSTWDTHYRTLTEQDPSLAWVTPKNGARMDQIQRPNPMPTEYDPNFRREHVSFDDKKNDRPVVWHPPSAHREKREQTRKQEHQEKSAEGSAPPPVFLPKEHVPYVPREMPYDAYSQTQQTQLYSFHGSNQQHYQEQLYQPQVHHPQPVHPQLQEQGRKFSQEIPNRIENGLPLPPLQQGKEQEAPSQKQEQQTPPPPPPPPVFEAPLQQWNAAQSAPPTNSRPEAHNWPSQVYENKWDQDKQDTKLFVPPRPASPPQNIDFEIPPRHSPTQPAPIFPWEERRIPRPTRVFAADYAEPAQESEEEEVVVSQVDEEFETEEASGGYDNDSNSGITSFESYSRTNAWDSIPAIERYVASFQRSTNPVRKSTKKGDMTPLPAWRSPQQQQLQDRGKAEEEASSVRVLPPDISVTPTPFKSMRGYRSNAMDDESKFPSAQGIPDQQHWDPLKSLEDLKNAPGEMLNKRSPPSPQSFVTTKGSPRSPASTVLLVSSSMPVPEKEFHITAYQRRHDKLLVNRSSSSDVEESSEASVSSSSPTTVFSDGVWRPKPRLYTTSSTQTEQTERSQSPRTSDAGTQISSEEIDAEMEALSIA